MIMVRRFAAAVFNDIFVSLPYYSISIFLITYWSEWREVMGDFVTQLRLAEKAAEDIYFAKVSRECIERLHKRMQAEKNSSQASDQSSSAARTDNSVEIVV